jgi:hypothetical protein
MLLSAIARAGKPGESRGPDSAIRRSSAWYTFFRTYLPRGCTTRDVDDKPVKGEVIVGTGIIQESVVRSQHDILALAHEKQVKAQEKEVRRKKAELDRQQAREKKEANRERAEEARAKKEARRRKAELDRQRALKKKAAQRKTVGLNQI